MLKKSIKWGTSLCCAGFKKPDCLLARLQTFSWQDHLTLYGSIRLLDGLGWNLPRKISVCWNGLTKIKFWVFLNLQYQDIGKGSITGSAMDRIKIRPRENNILPGIFLNVCIYTEIEKNTKYGISASCLECREKSRSSETFSFSWKVRGANNRPNFRSFVGRAWNQFYWRNIHILQGHWVQFK